MFFVEYTEKFSDALGPLPEPISCDNDLLHCKHRPTCYTNYAPHFSVNKTLDEVIVGKSTWVELGGIYQIRVFMSVLLVLR